MLTSDVDRFLANRNRDACDLTEDGRHCGWTDCSDAHKWAGRRAISRKACSLDRRYAPRMIRRGGFGEWAMPWEPDELRAEEQKTKPYPVVDKG